MSSILTNSSAMAALSTLRSINSDMDTTQNRISSGMRVELASDNAAYWSIATTMRSDNDAMSTVKDAIGLGAAKVDVAYTGMTSALEVVNEIKTKLVLASEPSTDLSKIGKEIEALQEQLRTIAGSAQFNGENLLASAATSTDIVTSFDRAADGTVAVSSITYTLDATTLLTNGTDDTGGLLADALAIDLNPATPFADAAARATYIETALSDVETALTGMNDAAAGLGAISKRISMQEEFVSNLMTAIDKGVGRLVDADMNEESTRLKALQTQQQLGIQALSIANSNSQNILSLFR
jgi:flagellin